MIELLTPAPYVTIKLAAIITGLTEKAIQRKIEDGKWVAGREYRKGPDGHNYISLEGYRKWVEQGPGLKSESQASGLNSRSPARQSANG